MSNRRFALVLLNVYGAATLLSVVIRAEEPLVTVARVSLMVGLVLFALMAITASDS